MIVDFHDGVGVGSDVYVDAFSYGEVALWGCADDGDVFDEIGEDGEFEVEAGAEDFDCGTCVGFSIS